MRSARTRLGNNRQLGITGNGVRACGAHPTRPQAAADKSEEERLPENSGSLCVADKRGGLKAQAGADAEGVCATAGRIEMDAGVVAGIGFRMSVAVIRAEG